MLGNRITARLCACRYEVQEATKSSPKGGMDAVIQSYDEVTDADGGLSTVWAPAFTQDFL